MLLLLRRGFPFASSSVTPSVMTIKTSKVNASDQDMPDMVNDAEQAEVITTQDLIRETLISVIKFGSSHRTSAQHFYISKGEYRPELEEYPFDEKSKHCRRFQKDWYTNFWWLEYSTHTDRAYCFQRASARVTFVFGEDEDEQRRRGTTSSRTTRSMLPVVIARECGRIRAEGVLQQISDASKKVNNGHSHHHRWSRHKAETGTAEPSKQDHQTKHEPLRRTEHHADKAHRTAARGH